MPWTLDLQRRDDAPWETIAAKPSGDACKTKARDLFRYVDRQRARFRIYDPQGLLWQVSEHNTGTKMRWDWVPPQSRDYTPEMPPHIERTLNEARAW